MIFVFISMRFNVCSIYKQYLRIDPTIFNAAVQYVFKESTKDLRLLKSTNVILAEGTKVEDRIKDCIT